MTAITEWNQSHYTGGDGVLIAIDMNQEWMLKWWWENYSKHNSFPIAIVDIGMSKSARNWCQSKGIVIHFPFSQSPLSKTEEIPKVKQEEWEKYHTKRIWDCRFLWLHKPFYMLQSPFDRTILIDCDCEIKDSLKPLFDYCETKDGISLLQMMVKGHVVIHTGVVVAKRNAPIFPHWAKEISKNHPEFATEDEALIKLKEKYPFKINPLSPKYNFLNYWKTNNHIPVYHHMGSSGKQEILKQIGAQRV